MSDWVRDAACAGQDLELWDTNEPTGYALMVCETCPVRGECLEEALRLEGTATVGGRWGIYGGLTPRDRHEIHMDRRRAEELERGIRDGWAVLETVHHCPVCQVWTCAATWQRRPHKCRRVEVAE